MTLSRKREFIRGKKVIIETASLRFESCLSNLAVLSVSPRGIGRGLIREREKKAPIMLGRVLSAIRQLGCGNLACACVLR